MNTVSFVRIFMLFIIASGKSIALVTSPSANRFFDFSGCICDMDGVLWRGSEKIPDSIEALNLLRTIGKEIVFVTNSSGKLRSEYALKLRNLGYPATTSQVITASSVTANFLRESIIGSSRGGAGIRLRKQPPTRVFMVGNPALQRELEECGFEVLSVDDSASSCLEEDEFAEISKNYLDPRVKAVVVGMDNAFSYRKLAIASLYLQNGCAFVATNPDSADRIPGGFWPEVGPLAVAIETASGVKPTMCGKPSTIMVRHVLSQLGCDKSRVLMVGDRLDTDIQFANTAGVSSCLVLSGCTSLEQAAKQVDSGPAARMPTYFAKNLWEMASHVVKNNNNKEARVA